MRRFIVENRVTIGLAILQICLLVWLYLFVVVPIEKRFNALDAEIAVRRASSNSRVEWWTQRMIADSLRTDSLKARLKALESIQKNPTIQEQSVVPFPLSVLAFFQSENISKLTDWEKILIGAISSLVAFMGMMALFFKGTLKYILDDKDNREKNIREDNANALKVISNNTGVIEGIQQFLEERFPKRR